VPPRADCGRETDCTYILLAMIYLGRTRVLNKQKKTPVVLNYSQKIALQPHLSPFSIGHCTQKTFPAAIDVQPLSQTVPLYAVQPSTANIASPGRNSKCLHPYL
jgi:hypothetical protein